MLTIADVQPIIGSGWSDYPTAIVSFVPDNGIPANTFADCLPTRERVDVRRELSVLWRNPSGLEHTGGGDTATDAVAGEALFVFDTDAHAQVYFDNTLALWAASTRCGGIFDGSFRFDIYTPIADLGLDSPSAGYRLSQDPENPRSAFIAVVGIAVVTITAQYLPDRIGENAIREVGRRAVSKLLA